jgi:LPXTG-site transpeptidase (sortase) family protein
VKLKRNISYYIGNLLIIVSFVGFVYLLSPIFYIYLMPPKVESKVNKSGIFLTIPKIRAQAQIRTNVDPFNKSEYMEVLKNNVAHAKGTALPGDKGTSFIFAHSSGNPWEITRMNTIFLKLNELNKGDDIEIYDNGRLLKYKVREKKEVFPSEVNYLLQESSNQLILQTCTPIGTDWKRLLVFADPV